MDCTLARRATSIEQTLTREKYDGSDEILQSHEGRREKDLSRRESRNTPVCSADEGNFLDGGKELRGSPSFKPSALTRISKRFKKHVQAIGELRVKIKTLQMSKLRRLIANMTPRCREELKKQKLKEINAIWKQNAKRLSSLRKEEMSLSFRREESIKEKKKMMNEYEEPKRLLITPNVRSRFRTAVRIVQKTMTTMIFTTLRKALAHVSDQR